MSNNSTAWLDNLESHLNANPMAWLLEDDVKNPGVRYFALRDLLDLAPDDPQVTLAQKRIMETGPVPVILSHQKADGSWEKDKGIYNPKYFSTVWQVQMLAQLGADGNDQRIKRSGDLLLSKYRCRYGAITGTPNSNAGLIQCLQGGLCSALIDLGWLADERLGEGIDWLARSVSGEGIAPAENKEADIRYYRSGNSGPGFLCSANLHKPCAWGAVKTMLALSKVPLDVRTPNIKKAIDLGLEFLLGVDPLTADYPTFDDRNPSQSWFRFGYPLFYVTDLLQNLEVLTRLGMGKDSRLKNAVDYLLTKQDKQARWKMTYTYNGKTWADIEKKNEPSKWVTLRVMRVLKRVFT